MAAVVGSLIEVLPGTHGVVGDGVTNDTVAIKALLKKYRRVVLMAGSFVVVSLSWTDTDVCSDLSCAQGGRFVGIAGAPYNSNLLLIRKDNVYLHHAKFQGVESPTLVEPETSWPPPGACVRVDNPTGRRYGVTVESCEFIGGQNGVYGVGTDFFKVLNCKFRNNYRHPISISEAARNTTIDGNDIEGESYFEAIKLATVMDGPGDASEDFVVTNNFIRGTGRIND